MRILHRRKVRIGCEVVYVSSGERNRIAPFCLIQIARCWMSLTFSLSMAKEWHLSNSSPELWCALAYTSEGLNLDQVMKLLQRQSFSLRKEKIQSVMAKAFVKIQYIQLPKHFAATSHPSLESDASQVLVQSCSKPRPSALLQLPSHRG